MLCRSGNKCEKCGQTKNHGPAIGVVVVLGLIGIGLIVSNRNFLMATAAYNFLTYVRLTGKVKFKVLFFALQVRCRRTRDV